MARASRPKLSEKALLTVVAFAKAQSAGWPAPDAWGLACGCFAF